MAAAAPVRSVVASVLATTTGTLPTFLLGGLSVQIAADLGLGAAQIGGLVTTFFTVSALSSTTAGRVTERLGPYRGLFVAATCAALALAGVGLLATNVLLFGAALAVAGVGNAIGHPASNLLLARGVPRHRQGLAFGLKQGAIPLASLLAGLAVPSLGLTIGWRWAFLLAVVGPLVVVAVAPRVGRPTAAGGRPRGIPDAPTRALVALAAATGTGTAAAITLSTFLVASAVARGTTPSRAGLLLALGSALGVTARIVVGARADVRGGGHLRAVRWLMATGVVGFVGLALPTSGVTLLVVTLVAFAAGWGWNGLLVYAVVQANPSAPAAATGITMTGLYVGGMGGPLLFGLLSDRWGFAAGWWLSAGLLALGLVCVLVGERWLTPGGEPHPV